MYGGEDGKDRKMNDLDNDLDTYWNDTSIESKPNTQKTEENVATNEKKQPNIENKEESDTTENEKNGL